MSNIDGILVEVTGALKLTDRTYVGEYCSQQIMIRGIRSRKKRIIERGKMKNQAECLLSSSP